MAEVNPAEISAILKQQLSGFSDGADLNEVGTVLEVGDGIARAYGLANVQSGELVQFENGQKGIVLNLEEDNVGIVLLAPSTDIKEGTMVKRTNTIASINVGEGVVGRVVDTLGKPIDGKGPIQGETFEMPLERKAPGVIFRQPVNEPMQTGIKSIDAITSALDPEVIGEVTGVIRKLVAEHNLTMLMVTHQMGFARDISDRVCFFYQGKIEEQGAPESLFGNPQRERTQQFLSAVKAAD